MGIRIGIGSLKIGQGSTGVDWSSYCTPLQLAETPAKVAFSADCTNDYVKTLIKDVRIYGGDPTHTYFFSFVETKLARRQFIITDLTTGLQICSKKITSTISEAELRALPTMWKLNDLNVGPIDGYNSVYAVIEVDWSVATLTQNIYTTVAQGGIDTACVKSKAMLANFLKEPIYHEKITVGSGKDYETLKAAVESLWNDPTTMNPVTYNLTVQRYGCWKSHYDYQYLIELDAGNFTATGLYIPEFVHLRGAGSGLTFITSETTDHNPPLEIHWESKIYGVTIQSNTGDDGAWIGEYCIHSDDINYVSKHGNRKLMQLYYDVNLIGGTSQNTWLFGCGISSDEEIIIIDCDGGHLNETYALTKPTFGVHSASASLYPALLVLKDCSSTDVSGVAIQDTDPISEQTNICKVSSATFIDLVSVSGWTVVRI